MLCICSVVICDNLAGYNKISLHPEISYWLQQPNTILYWFALTISITMRKLKLLNFTRSNQTLGSYMWNFKDVQDINIDLKLNEIDLYLFLKLSFLPNTGERYIIFLVFLLKSPVIGRKLTAKIIQQYFVSGKKTSKRSNTIMCPTFAEGI